MKLTKLARDVKNVKKPQRIKNVSDLGEGNILSCLLAQLDKNDWIEP